MAKPEEYLIARILKNRVNIPFIAGFGATRAGSFTSLEAANKLVNSTLSDPVNRARIEAFRNSNQAVLEITKRFRSPTGYEVYAYGNRKPKLRETYWVGVRLRRTDRNKRGYYVDSAWPRNP